MTNEEARDVLITMSISVEMNATSIVTNKELCEALDMAIKALEDKGYEQGYADGFAECLDLNT